jgi:hypothetical protein
MKPRHSAEQSNMKVNKAETMGKVGFAALRQKRSEEVVATENIVTPPSTPIESDVPVSPTKAPEFVVHAPEDPADAHICEGCQ